MAVEQLEVQQETELDRALHVIHQDNTLFPITFGPNGKTATRLEVYNKMFGEEAKLNYYKNFPDLPIDKINAVLENGIVQLAGARVIVHLPSVIIGELKKAQKLQKTPSGDKISF